MHRGIKLGNIVLNFSTGVAALLDFGCMMRLDGSDYCRGGSTENIPPEYAALTNGLPATYMEDELRKPLSTPAVDVLLLAHLAIEMIFDLPAELQYGRYAKDLPSFIAYLTAVRTYDWSGHLAYLRANSMSDLADFLAACLATDPAQRPTAAQALQMPFLAAVAEEVDAAVAAATPGYIAECQAAVEMLAELQGEPFTFVTDQYHVHSDTCSCETSCTCSSDSSSKTCSSETCSSETSSINSLSDTSSSDDNSNECCSSRCSESSSTVPVTSYVQTIDNSSRDSCSTATDCCSGEQAEAVLAAASVLQAMACSNSSSIVPVTPNVQTIDKCSSSSSETNNSSSLSDTSSNDNNSNECCSSRCSESSSVVPVTPNVQTIDNCSSSSSETNNSSSLSDNSRSDDTSDECCSSRCSENSSIVPVISCVQSTDNSSGGSCSTATDCCSGEQAEVALPATSVLQAMACSNSSSIMPVTPCLDSGRHNCSSISGCCAEEQSSAESDTVQQ
jgi:serine/threonine protein kinase